MNLQHLDLSENEIGVDGAVAIAKALKNAVNLQHLDLSENNIGDDGAVAIAEGLKNAASLQRLNLKWNRIGPDGVAALAEGISSVKEGPKILIQGSRIVGKSTLLRHIENQWAEGKFMQSFPLVILVDLGHTPSNQITNLESILEYHSYKFQWPDTASVAFVARELSHTGGDGICFLLDAIYYSSPQSPTHNDYIYQLIRGDILPNAAVMATIPEYFYYYIPLREHFTFLL